MGKLYKQEWLYFKRDYFRPFTWVLIVSLIISVLAYFVLLANPEVALESMQNMVTLFESKGISPEIDLSNWDMFKIILVNNLRASAFMVLLGFIPLIILPGSSAVITSLSISVLLAFMKIQGGTIGGMVLVGLMPHGVLEIVALLVASGIGIFLSLSVARRLFSREKEGFSLRANIIQALRSFVLLVVPAIIIAAVIEGFVTSNLVEMFLK